MYNQLKGLLKSVIPSTVLNKNEKVIRSVVYQFYRGNNKKCNICNASLKTFVGDNQVCPRCGSIHRGRKLFSLLEAELKNRTSTAKVLHLSPAKSLKDKIKSSFEQITYHTSDYVGEFSAENNFDLRATNLDSDTYDITICYHILEHIIEDTQAMSELYRITKPKGVCFIQTPFHSTRGESIEDYSIVSPSERLEHFGQEDHVRIYSVESLENRLRKAGFTIQRLSFTLTDESDNLYGYKQEEYVLLAHKY